jgi:hypothetical protein
MEIRGCEYLTSARNFRLGGDYPAIDRPPPRFCLLSEAKDLLLFFRRELPLKLNQLDNQSSHSRVPIITYALHLSRSDPRIGLPPRKSTCFMRRIRAWLSRPGGAIPDGSERTP